MAGPPSTRRGRIVKAVAAAAASEEVTPGTDGGVRRGVWLWMVHVRLPNGCPEVAGLP